MIRKLAIAAAATALTCATVPASAEDFFVGADRSGAGVQVGPFGVGVGPRFGWRDRHWDDGYYAYGAGECRIVRERIVTPSGRVVYRQQRIC